MVDSDTAACVVPFMFRLGRIPLELEVNGVFRYAIIFTLSKSNSALELYIIMDTL